MYIAQCIKDKIKLPLTYFDRNIYPISLIKSLGIIVIGSMVKGIKQDRELLQQINW